MMIIKHIDTIIPNTPEGKAYAEGYETLTKRNGTYVKREEDTQAIIISERFFLSMDNEGD